MDEELKEWQEAQEDKEMPQEGQEGKEQPPEAQEVIYLPMKQYWPVAQVEDHQDQDDDHQDQDEDQDQDENQGIPNGPTLQPAAYCGFVGELLRTAETQTEASPGNVLLDILAPYGNIVGRGAWVTVTGKRHHPALYVGIFGPPSAAKGDGWNAGRHIFFGVNSWWADKCVANGVGSGEGLVERVEDPMEIVDSATGEVIGRTGAEDTRCLLRLSELSIYFKRGRGPRSTLAEYLLQAWDGDPIHIPNRKPNALTATKYTISVCGDITPAALHRALKDGVEGENGWASRFLWGVTSRSRFLPNGGNLAGLAKYLPRLEASLNFAQQAGPMRRDAQAEKIWKEVYPGLRVSGDRIPHTEKAAPYVLRISMIYALADCSNIIRIEHLAAALAVWAFCGESARILFAARPGDSPRPPCADPLWRRVLAAIRAKPGISKRGLHKVFGNNLKAEELANALAYLEANGLAFKVVVQPRGGGRPGEQWYPR
jgi:hypothetical protein